VPFARKEVLQAIGLEPDGAVDEAVLVCADTGGCWRAAASGCGRSEDRSGENELAKASTWQDPAVIKICGGGHDYPQDRPSPVTSLV
jgi:hypothetical protein